MRGPASVLLHSLALVAAGAVTGLAFAPTQWWVLAFVGVAGFIGLVRHDLPVEGSHESHTRRVLASGLGRGYLYGLGLHLVLVPWVAVLGWYVAVALILLMAGFSSLAAAGIVLTRGSRWWPLWAATSWSLSEFAAARVPFGGFPWARLAWTVADQPLAGYLPWVSVAGTSFLLALSAALLVAALTGLLDGGTRARHRRWAALTAATVVLLGGAVLRLAPVPAPEDDQVTVGMVQGNVDGVAGASAMGYARSVTNNHLSETITLMARARTGTDPVPDFVLWPENSTDIDPTRDPETAALVADAIAIAERPIFLGIVASGPGPGERQTTGLWWDPERGPGPRYDKRNLVPFGEYVPLRDLLLPWLPILEQVGAQGIPGTLPGVLEVDVDGQGLGVGDIICFELAYDQTVHDVVTHGAQVVLVQSNNATYTATGQPHQQFQITRVRAIELRREVVVATTSSFSGLIDPRGRVLDRTRESTAAARSYTVPLRTAVSPAARLGVGIDTGLAVVGALAIVAHALRRRRLLTPGQAPGWFRVGRRSLRRGGR